MDAKERKEHLDDVKEKFPDKIPVIIEPCPEDTSLKATITNSLRKVVGKHVSKPLPFLLGSNWQYKHKFLFPVHSDGLYTTSAFVLQTIRTYLRNMGAINEESSVFMFDSDFDIIPVNKLLTQVASEHKADDGHLHIYFSLESTFGGIELEKAKQL
jgi:hypothetical protein